MCAPEEAYRSALALNNMATALMQRGFYAAAVKTATESLIMMRAAFVGPDNNNNNDKEAQPPQDHDNLRHNPKKKTRCPVETMKIASQRYVKTLQQGTATNNRRGAWCLPLEAEADPVDDDDFAGLRAAATYGPSSTIVFPIRISQSALDESDTSTCLQRQFGILLYNHALAHFLASKAPQQSHPKKLLKRAYKSYRMAEATFLRLTDEQEDGYTTADLSTLLLSAIVLNGMSLVFSLQELTNKAEEVQETVSFLCSSVDDDVLTDMLVQRHCAAAA